MSVQNLIQKFQSSSSSSPETSTKKSASKMAEFTLHNYDGRAQAEVTRLIFAYAKCPYNDCRFSPDSGEFPADLKPKLPYGQVPILEFGDGTILSQSSAIQRFLSQKFNLLGANPMETARIDEIVDAARDYIASFNAYRFAPSDEAKEAAKKNIMEKSTPRYAGKFEKILNKNVEGYFVGKNVTLADLVVFNLFNHMEICTGLDLTQGFPAIQKFMKKIEAIPQIKEWLDQRPKTPI